MSMSGPGDLNSLKLFKDYVRLDSVTISCNFCRLTPIMVKLSNLISVGKILGVTKSWGDRISW